MNRLVNAMVLYCVRHQIISEEKKGWFRYGLEKRLSTLLVSFPCMLLAVYFSGIYVTVSFLASFCFLRARTNGYHANTQFGCMCGSIFLELIFLGIIYPNLSMRGTGILIATSCILIYLMAPYNNVKIHFTQEELFVCQRSVRTRVGQLVTLTVFLLSFGIVEIAKGISLGCAMTSLLLCFAYISERRFIV